MSLFDAAFRKLQAEMDEQIRTRLDDTRRKLFECFDEDVHQRLRLQLADAQAQLDRVGKRFWAVTRFMLDGRARFDDDALAFNLDQPPREQKRRRCLRYDGLWSSGFSVFSFQLGGKGRIGRLRSWVFGGGPAKWRCRCTGTCASHENSRFAIRCSVPRFRLPPISPRGRSEATRTSSGFWPSPVVPPPNSGPSATSPEKVGVLSAEQMDPLVAELKAVSKMLTGLAKSIRPNPNPNPKTEN